MLYTLQNLLFCKELQGSNLLPFRLSGKVENCSGKAKVGGRFSSGKIPVFTSINAKKLKFSGREG